MVLGIYTRVSTDEQYQYGISLDNQISRGKELSLKLGCDYKLYSDAGYSGKIPFDKRPGLNSLIDDILHKKIKSVFVFDLDRLSRGDIIQTTIIKNIFKDNEIRLFDVNSEINLFDPSQELLTDIRSLLAAYEIKKTSLRISSVLEQNVQKGKVGGGPLIPFGYTKDKDKNLIIDEDESKIVELIYKLALEGKGTKSIATVLNNNNIPTKRGRVETGYKMKVKGESKTTFTWRDSVIYRILTNPIYKGERLYKGNTYKSPIIIDQRLFDTIKIKLDTRNQFKNTTNKYTYLLKGIIHCSYCKGKFYGHKRLNGKDNAYVCNSKRYGGEFCGNVGISIDYLDNLVINNILNLEDTMKRVFEDIKKNDAYKNGKNYYLNICKKQIKETNDGINNLLDITQRAGIDPKTFNERFQKLNKRLTILKEKEKKYTKDLGILNDENVVMDFVKGIVKDFKNTKETDEKINYIRNLISQIYIKWEPDQLTHWISINFRIDELNNYIFTKDISVNRTGIKNNKRIEKIISDDIRITNVIGGYKDRTHLSYK